MGILKEYEKAVLLWVVPRGTEEDHEKFLL
jgi:hypothetical protein